ncbi:DUF2634 domain-containing protein [Paucisalibacillus globulus]|uniref:DUF2634 domain-containing protein n=1 Tax=Paucisalibacillus globulus TaxID=351095 RepID=UPI000BB8B2E0|nr:DUF2634 domain-containing protein [Paucisalibacillus globulus]
MIPQQLENDGLTLDFEEEMEPSKTFKLDLDLNRCVGFVDDLEAVRQAIFLMTSIERYEHIIYSWDVGIELQDLYGMPTAYVASEIPRRLQECLLQDDRITAVDSFEVTAVKKKVHVKYVAHTIYGDIEIESEVDY